MSKVEIQDTKAGGWMVIDVRASSSQTATTTIYQARQSTLSDKEPKSTNPTPHFDNNVKLCWSFHGNFVYLWLHDYSLQLGFGR